ncbi:unnamed protein product [Caretta caretta]
MTSSCNVTGLNCAASGGRAPRFRWSQLGELPPSLYSRTWSALGYGPERKLLLPTAREAGSVCLLRVPWLVAGEVFQRVEAAGEWKSKAKFMLQPPVSCNFFRAMD